MSFYRKFLTTFYNLEGCMKTKYFKLVAKVANLLIFIRKYEVIYFQTAIKGQVLAVMLFEFSKTIT